MFGLVAQSLRWPSAPSRACCPGSRRGRASRPARGRRPGTRPPPGAGRRRRRTRRRRRSGRPRVRWPTVDPPARRMSSCRRPIVNVFYRRLVDGVRAATAVSKEADLGEDVGQERPLLVAERHQRPAHVGRLDHAEDPQAFLEPDPVVADRRARTRRRRAAGPAGRAPAPRRSGRRSRHRSCRPARGSSPRRSRSARPSRRA